MAFSRFETVTADVEGEFELGSIQAPLAKKVTWLPAIENRGERIFIQFSKEQIDGWLARPEVRLREDRLRLGFLEWESTIRQWPETFRRSLTVEICEGKLRAGTEVVPGDLKFHLAKWGIVDRDLPGALWNLSLAQSATFVNAEGLTLRVCVEVPEHIFRFEEVPDEE